jgi:nickel-type superoxide dismutase maturation protease
LEKQQMNHQLINWLLWIVRKRCRIKIKGNSMIPILRDGDTVYVNQRAYKHTFPEVGDIVIVRHPYQTKRQLIKRVGSINAKHQLVLMEINQQRNTDRRLFGAVPCHYIKGEVVGIAKRSGKRATG